MDNSSSTSSSKRATFVAMLWCGLFLVLIDLAGGALVAMVNDNYDHPLYSVADYLDRGRSIPGKLRRNILPNENVLVGWPKSSEPDEPSDAPVGVDVFGMSFAEHLMSRVVVASDGKLSGRYRLGPAATLSQSYAAFQAHKDALREYAVLGVLSSSLPFVQATSHMTWTPEYPFAPAHAQYAVKNGEVTAVQRPKFDSGLGFREAGAPLAEVVGYVRETDPFYDPMAFAEFGDASTLGRLIKRALVVRRQQAQRDAHYDPKRGFKDAQDVTLARAIIESFVRQARALGAKPVVLLIATQGQGEHLNAAFNLDEQGPDAPCVFRTHPLIDANEPGSYDGSGHFTDSANDQLAAALAEKCFE